MSKYVSGQWPPVISDRFWGDSFVQAADVLQELWPTHLFRLLLGHLASGKQDDSFPGVGLQQLLEAVPVKVDNHLFKEESRRLRDIQGPYMGPFLTYIILPFNPFPGLATPLNVSCLPGPALIDTDFEDTLKSNASFMPGPQTVSLDFRGRHQTGPWDDQLNGWFC